MRFLDLKMATQIPPKAETGNLKLSGTCLLQLEQALQYSFVEIPPTHTKGIRNSLLQG